MCPLALRRAAAYPSATCTAHNNRHRNEAILDIARAMQLDILYLPEFPLRHRIGIKNRGLILRPTSDGPLTWSWARWSISRQVPRSRRLIR